jgi:autotransporter-associated beta strand protein
MTNGGTLAAVTGGDARFSGNFSGSGNLAIGDTVNTGVISLGGTANTYLGSTTILSGATLQALSTGALSPGSAFIVLGTLNLNGFSNQIGSLAGTATVINQGLAGALLTAGGDNSSTTFSGVLRNGTGTLGLTEIGAGTLTLAGANTYSGGNTISAGNLQIGNGGTSGSIIGNVLDNGNLSFNRSDAVTFTGPISGTGNLSQIDSGILTLNGYNSYSGATTISDGSLQAGAATGLSGNSAFTVAAFPRTGGATKTCLLRHPTKAGFTKGPLHE